ncbi:type II toxin-antitoxin system RelE/ParE family toxin [Pseudokineococcus basanitobsidens]|uniref:Type II toxin-antitoxin system RelE/ParE family toxin n=1 Tax=Pseudokineococcus basanitobsidens TaxID=1926649 RepID=A0ABU8RIW2_9ACTN
MTSPSEDEDERFSLVITPTARRQLTDVLPEAPAFAAYEFIVGPLLDDPHRVGKQVRAPLHDRHGARRGTYRVLYRIDDLHRTVTVLDVAHRRDAYQR